MVDIWGRRDVTKKSEPVDENKIEKIIKDEIASTLNLASVDPNEVVVFENRQGKLKSSNISLDDILNIAA